MRYPPATPKSHDTKFQKPIDISLNNFKVYVNEKDYLMSNLNPITADWLQDLKDKGKVIDVSNYNIWVAETKNSERLNILTCYLQLTLQHFFQGYLYKI